MGLSESLCLNQEAREILRTNRLIDKQIVMDHLEDKKKIKLLLLGTGDSGKSTLIKQMRILHSVPFTKEEILFQKFSIFNNTVTAMTAILKYMDCLGIQLENGELKPQMLEILDRIGRESEPPTPELPSALKALWSDKTIKEIVKHGNEFHLMESAPYFFDSIDRISDPFYMPTEQDILLTRIQTQGVVKIMIRIKSINFDVFDVGGQRSQRKKWIYCFDNVSTIIFLASLSEFDQVLYEDRKRNRLIESIELFDLISNMSYFVKTSIILFLNKKDLFAEKIERKSIKVLFNEYNGSQTYEDQIFYITRKFLDQNRVRDKSIYSHQTCATDTNQTKVILNNVTDYIIKMNLRQFGLN